ncbi:NAD(P)-dependent oxidoreductase [Roseivirga misakiensis]|uniref:NADH-flavin reductase n=1 Tax=Roseivirga misakiensis TaxID=1563681 RepID=A0A1E5SYQ2_9BACT|nr:NAD(P)H-binding protein [Roseivirga misakiensis]OEK04250.1 NADH-flavin reductase [Roseivirga misakiensis]
MKQIIKIAILGGNGRTGKFLVNQLLNQGFSLKLLIRDPNKFSVNNPLIDIVAGDALDEDKVDTLIEGCQAVMGTMSQREGEPLLSSTATRYILKAMLKYEVKRYIVLAGINIDTPFDQKDIRSRMATEFMKANYPVPHADKQKSYAILAESSIDWTFVRVPLIDFDAAITPITINLENCIGDKISAASIAAFMIDQLTKDDFIRQAPFISNA